MKSLKTKIDYEIIEWEHENNGCTIHRCFFTHTYKQDNLNVIYIAEGYFEFCKQKLTLTMDCISIYSKQEGDYNNDLVKFNEEQITKVINEKLYPIYGIRWDRQTKRSA